MCSSRENSVGRTSDGSWSGSGGNWGRSARWSGVNIAAMVVGFVFFWPVGLVVLYWIMTGRNVQELPGAVRDQWNRMFNGSKTPLNHADNIVFSEYQQTQYDRIREIREEIKSRAQRFGEFRMDARRRADQEEFDRFMANGSRAGRVDQ